MNTVNLHLLLLILAFVLFVLSALQIPNPSSRVRLDSLGLALLVLAMIIRA